MFYIDKVFRAVVHTKESEWLRKIGGLSFTISTPVSHCIGGSRSVPAN